MLQQRESDLNSFRQKNIQGVIFSNIVNELWGEVSKTSSFISATEGVLRDVWDDLQSRNLSSLNSESVTIMRSFSASIDQSSVTKCVELQLDDGSISLCFSNLTCTDISIPEVASSYKYPTSIFLAIIDLGITCTTEWSLSFETHVLDKKHHKTFHYEGLGGFTMSNFQSSTDLNFFPGASSSCQNILIPEKLKFENCYVNTTSLQIDIFFSGGLIGKVLDRFVAPAISHGLLNSINWLLCDVFAPIIGRAGTRFLENTVDPKIDNIMSLGVKIPPVSAAGYYSWSTSFLFTIHKMFDMLRLNDASFLKCIVGQNIHINGKDHSDYDNNMLSVTKTRPNVHGFGANYLVDLKSLLETAIKDLSPLDIIVDGIMEGNGLGIEITAVAVDGFKTLSDMELLYPSLESNVTLLSSLTFKALRVNLSVRLTYNSDIANSRDLMVSLLLSNVVLDLDLVIALRSSVINQLYLDQVFNLPCVLSALEDFYISSLFASVTVTEFDVFVKDSIDSDDLNKLVNNAIDLVIKGYPSMTSQLISGIFQGPLRKSLNNAINETVSRFKENHPSFQCKSHVAGNESLHDWIVWSNSTAIEKLNKIINIVVGPTGVNNLVSCLTDKTNMAMINVPLSSPVLGGWNITLSGLNSFFEFEIVSPEEKLPYDLLNDIALGGECAATKSIFSHRNYHGNHSRKSVSQLPCVPLNVTIKGYENNGNYVDVKLSVKDVRLLLDILFELDEVTLGNMRVSEFHSQGCAAKAVDVFQVAYWGLHTASVDFFFVEESEDISITQLANSVFEVLLSPSNQESLNSYIRNSLTQAEDVCAAGGVSPSSLSDPSDERNMIESIMHFFLHTWKWKVGVLIAGTLISFSFLLRIYYKKGVHLDISHVKNDISTQLHPDSMSLEHNAYTVNENNLAAETMNFLSNSWIRYQIQSLVDVFYKCKGTTIDITTPQVPPFDSLIGNEVMSVFTRISVVVLIIIIVYIFVVSEVPSSPAALVIMEIGFGDHVSPPITVFTFGLAKTVREMWSAEVYYLAVLIAFFTGGWPYIKMVAMLLAWILPSFVLSVEWRNSLLVWLDLLGKWSLVDSFVMMVMMVGFHFSFDIVPGVNIRVTVDPQWGFYAFLLATAASLAMGHFVLACHRLCDAADYKDEVECQIMESNCDGLLKQGSRDTEHDKVVTLHSESISSKEYHFIQTEEKREDDIHLHSTWANKALVSQSSQSECESLMNHVFTIIVDFDPSISVCDDQSMGESVHEPLMQPNDSNNHVVHLSDLTEWNFQQECDCSCALNVSFTDIGKVFVGGLFMVSTVMVVVGTVIPVIEFDFVGLTGYLMDEPITSYSLVDIGLKIPPASGDPHDFGVLFIQIIYFVFGIMMPMVFFTLLGVLFVVPFTLPTFRGVVVLTEVLNAWAALDVLVVSGVASVLEIRRFAEFMLGESCEDMNNILKATMDEELEGHDSCFDVIASMKDTSCLAYGATFLLIAVGLLMRGLGHKAVKERSDDLVTQSNSVAIVEKAKKEKRVSKSRWSKFCQNLLLISLRTLQTVRVISVKKKISV